MPIEQAALGPQGGAPRRAGRPTADDEHRALPAEARERLDRLPPRQIHIHPRAQAAHTKIIPDHDWLVVTAVALPDVELELDEPDVLPELELDEPDVVPDDVLAVVAAAVLAAAATRAGS